MKPLELFELYAPPESIWSPWAKPVLFAHAARITPGAANELAELEVPRDVSWAPGTRDATAIIVDMPGVSSVAWGLALAEAGYRPVPLYNTSPGPMPVVDASGVLRALIRGADRLRELRIDPSAPPAFLLDSERISERLPAQPGMYDNRWLVFPQDFPSASRLQHAGIQRIVLAQRTASQPQRDLAHVLHAWSRSQIAVAGCGLESGDGVDPLPVRKPTSFGYLWYRAMVSLGLRRNSAGGFGSIVPMASESSGFA